MAEEESCFDSGRPRVAAEGRPSQPFQGKRWNPIATPGIGRGRAYQPRRQRPPAGPSSGFPRSRTRSWGGPCTPPNLMIPGPGRPRSMGKGPTPRGPNIAFNVRPVPFRQGPQRGPAEADSAEDGGRRSRFFSLEMVRPKTAGRPRHSCPRRSGRVPGRPRSAAGEVAGATSSDRLRPRPSPRNCKSNFPAVFNRRLRRPLSNPRARAHPAAPPPEAPSRGPRPESSSDLPAAALNRPRHRAAARGSKPASQESPRKIHPRPERRWPRSLKRGPVIALSRKLSPRGSSKRRGNKRARRLGRPAASRASIEQDGPDCVMFSSIAREILPGPGAEPRAGRARKKSEGQQIIFKTPCPNGGDRNGARAGGQGRGNHRPRQRSMAPIGHD